MAHPFTADEFNAGYQGRDGAAHGVGPHEQRFMQPARAQQPVGKHMTAFRISTKLNFVNRQEITAHRLWHRFDGANPISRAWGDDAFLPRYQGHNTGAAQGNDFVINLARKQAQRQADNAGAVAQHPFDGVMRLAGVGRPKDRDSSRIGARVIGHISPYKLCSELLTQRCVFQALYRL